MTLSNRTERILEQMKRDEQNWRDVFRGTSDIGDFIEFVNKRSGVEVVGALHEMFDEYWKHEAQQEACASEVEEANEERYRREVAIAGGA